MIGVNTVTQQVDVEPNASMRAEIDYKEQQYLLCVRGGFVCN